MIELVEYETEDGGHPFANWFDNLNPPAALRVRRALAKIEVGNLSNVKSVGGGVLEYRIDFGPGYRVYFGRDGDMLVILLAGGTKKRQQRDIDRAIGFWVDYKRRKRRER